MEAEISSPKGCLLRVNRSIQVEGNFAYIKHDLDFRWFFLRGNVKVAAEWLLFSVALNISFGQAVCLITAPSGARFPFRMAMAPSVPIA